ncbi:hypothetical protein [Natronoglycomyces albus]|uniref:Uncharacterized protein n=1 Tax=Natronoglycomyces albus TaxID=2811108 RepID=A0A895XLE6_9ACTN|nr:hypothetical protein [Natronoglycomyces albus]QSB04373.1 hypothetical protein JQS30_11275 [Natronoglycomyces albus]
MKQLLYTSRHPRPVTSWNQDAITALASTWLIGGLIVSVWSHATGRGDGANSWQLIFYTGLLALAAWVGLLLYQQIRSGRSGLAAIALGYGPLVAAVPLFLIAGLVNLIWHGTFGVEIGPEVLMSPAQLAVAITLILMASAPWLAAMPRLETGSAPRPLDFLPALGSLSAVLAVVTLLLSFGIAFLYHGPATVELLRPDATGAFGPHTVALLASIVLTTVLIVTLLLFVGRRWQTPLGTFTLLFFGPALMVGAVAGFDNKGMVLLFLLSGVLADGLAWFVRPHLSRRRDLIIFAAGWAFATWLGFFIVGRLQAGEWAAAHMWSGVPLVAAAVAALIVVTVQPTSGIEPRSSRAWPRYEGIEPEERLEN